MIDASELKFLPKGEALWILDPAGPKGARRVLFQGWLEEEPQSEARRARGEPKRYRGLVWCETAGSARHEESVELERLFRTREEAEAAAKAAP